MKRVCTAFTICCIIVCMFLCGCGFLFGGSTKTKIRNTVEKTGYEAVFLENSKDFYIEDGNIKYYFTWKRSKGKLVKIVFEAYTANPKVIDGIGTITMQKEKGKKVQVIIEDTVIVSEIGDKVQTFNEYKHFTCEADFEKDSIASDNAIWGKDKAMKYYNYVTSNFVTKEELCDIYEAGLELEKTINVK